MQQNNIVLKIEKEFRHRIYINYDINKIDYEVCNFYSQVNIIGNGRLLVVSGVYDVYWRPLYKGKKNYLQQVFQEIVYTDNLALQWENIEVVSSLQGNPILTQSSYSFEYGVLVGNICCDLYNSSQVRKEEAVVSSVSINIESDNRKEFFEVVPVERTGKKNKKRKDIICISSTRWDFIRQRPHHLMDLLSKRNNRVLFFNHSVAVSYEEAVKRQSNPELWNEKLEKISENLWVFSPVHILQGNSGLDRASLQLFNYQLKEEALRFLIYKLQFYDIIFITYLAESINYIRGLPKKLICYDCIDDFSAFSWTEEGIEEDEERLIKKSDIVITSAEVLFNRIKKIHQNTFLLPNAVEYEHFAATYKKSRTGRSPIIGFIGAFYEWVDEELIEYLAKKRKEWIFYFIGPVQSGMGTIINELENMRFFGTIDYNELPRFLNLIDVCIIPFKQNRITQSANPIKLWEYMASGKPIISTAIPEVKKFADIIYIAETKEEFLLKLEKALKENSKELAKRRIAVARRNDWNHRVEKLVKIIESIEY